MVPAPPAGNTRALKTGAQADGRNLPAFSEVLADVEQVISQSAPWVQATDRYAVELFAASLTTFHHTEAALARMTPTALMKKHKAARVNVQRLRALNEMARDLGLTPAGRAKLGLVVARTEREIQLIRPVRSEERAAEVARILTEARAIVPIDTEPVVEEPAETAEAEVVPLRVAEDAPPLAGEAK